jgi:polyhydroxybutyrate depolymerase
MFWLLWMGCTEPGWPSAPPADACAAGAIPEGEYVLRLTVGPLERSALVYMPSSAGPHDIVVNLHEFNSEPRRQAHYSRWLPEARSHGAILVAPDGKTATWNAGACCGKAMQRNYDDVAFLDAVTDAVSRVGCSSGRVVATGIGAGAMMAQRWACESDVPDAILSVGGELQRDRCLGTRPIPALMFHGGADQWMPMDGSGGHAPSKHGVDAWIQRNHATETASTLPGAFTCRRYDGDAPVEFCVVPGMAGLWPGAEDARAWPDATLLGYQWIRDAWDAGKVPK